MPKYVGRLELTNVRKTLELSRNEKFMGSLIFHLTSKCKQHLHK